MDLTSLVFLALMVAFTGLMAYAGDSLGRWLGKKRVKVFGLRPKHTAALLTAGAGSFGALLVVLVLMAISEPVRVWILSGNQVREELRAAQKELSEASKARETLDKELGRVRSQAAKEVARAAEADQKNKALSGENKRLLFTSEKVQAEISNKTAEAAKLRKEVEKERGLLAVERSLLADVRKQYEVEKQGAQTIRADNSAIQKRNLELTKANLTLENQKMALEKSSAALEQETQDLQTSLDSLRKTFDAASTQQRAMLSATQNQLAQSMDELSKTNELLDDVRRDLANLERERLALLGLSEASRQQPIVMERQDELSRVPIPANCTLAEARALLGAAIQRAERTAINRGSGVSPLTRSAVIFVELRAPGKPALTSDMQREAIIQEMAGKPDPRVIILRALTNSFVGEPVPLDAVIYRNPVVYQSGQVVAETRLDGRLDQDEIAERLEDFVRGPMAQAIVRAGVIPAKGMPQPLGEVSRDAVLTLVQSVKQSGVSVRVQFLAATETRAGDPLKINFRMR